MLDGTQRCHCIIQTPHQCPSAELCESSQDDAYRKEKPAWWCLLLAATSLRWTTKSVCSLRCCLSRVLLVFQRAQLKSGFMLYAKVDFSHEHAYESKQRVQHSSWEQPPYPKPRCPDVRGTTKRQAPLCPQGHVCHCPYEGTQGRGWQKLKAVPVWMGHASHAPVGWRRLSGSAPTHCTDCPSLVFFHVRGD